MKPIAIATNELGMHVMVRPVPRQFLSDEALDEVAAEDVNALSPQGVRPLWRPQSPISPRCCRRRPIP